MIHDRRQLGQYVAWNIVIPIVVPIFAVVAVIALLREEVVSLGVVFGRPDFYLLSALLSGETYAENLSSRTKGENGTKHLVRTVIGVLLPAVSVLSVGMYFFTYAEPQVAPGTAAVAVSFLCVSVVAAVMSWLSFNHKEKGNHKEKRTDGAVRARRRR